MIHLGNWVCQLSLVRAQPDGSRAAPTTPPATAVAILLDSSATTAKSSTCSSGIHKTESSDSTRLMALNQLVVDLMVPGSTVMPLLAQDSASTRPVSALLRSAAPLATSPSSARDASRPRRAT